MLRVVFAEAAGAEAAMRLQVNAKKPNRRIIYKPPRSVGGLGTGRFFAPDESFAPVLDNTA
jgi:hypothetical protein